MHCSTVLTRVLVALNDVLQYRIQACTGRSCLKRLTVALAVFNREQVARKCQTHPDILFCCGV